MDIFITKIPQIDINEVNEIVDSTVNTRQANRSRDSKFADTKLGKSAEKIIEDYIKENKSEYGCISYDKIRKDNYSKHAPFDLLLYKTGISKPILNNFINKINNEILNNDYGKISDSLKEELEENGILIVEIKSTRVAQRHLANGNEDSDIINTIQNEDDFLEYPKYLRVDNYNTMNSINSYINFCNKYRKTSIHNEQELREIERKNMRHIYIRVYLNESTNKAYVMGFLDHNYFSKNFVLKKMPQPGKSEKALYLAVSLKNAKSIKDL